MKSRFKVFDFIDSPVVVFGSASEVVFTNLKCKKVFSSDICDLVNTETEDRSVVFNTDRGYASCYQIEKSFDDNGFTIVMLKEITDFMSRKSMTEIYASKDNDYPIRKIVEKNTRMSNLIDSLESGIFLEGSSGNLIQVNNSFLEMISPAICSASADEYNAEFFHRMLADLIESDTYCKDVEKLYSDLSINQHIDEVRLKNGSVYQRTFIRMFIMDEPKGFLWKFKDITISKELENSKFELESTIEALSSCEAVGVYMDYAGYQFMNKGLLNTFGADREEIRANGLSHYIGEDISDIDFKILNPEEGRYIQIFADSFKVSGKEAKIVSAQDISEKTMLEKAIERSEKRFRNIFLKNMAVMLIFDIENLSIVDANSSAAEYYGYSISELCSMDICDITKSDNKDSCLAGLKMMAEEGGSKRIPVQQMLSDGTLRDVELILTPIEIDEDKLIFVIVDDISERLKYERELVKVNTNLQTLVRLETEHRRRHEELLMEKMRLAEMGEMVGNIAHQWRQPLNTLGIIIQDLQDAKEFGELDDEYIEGVVETGMQQIDYMSKTIDDFRDFFKPSKEIELFDVKKCIAQVMSILLPQFKKNDINLNLKCVCHKGSRIEKSADSFEYCEGHTMLSYGYVNQFKQVLLNLLSNSKDALSGQSDRKVWIDVVAQDKNIVIDVNDNGGGIPDNIIDNIFEAYFTTKDSNGGTGIGLYMSKAIIEDNMKGSLTVANTEEGCRFRIKLKREEPVFN